MSRAIVIARRELTSYFYSPMAYVAMALFLGTTGYLFMQDMVPGQPASLRTLFNGMVWVLAFILPILSMGLLCNEKTNGTIETLMTAPVSDTDVVLGKFIGSYLYFLILLAPTLLYVIVLSLYSRPEAGPIISGYLGMLLVGGMFLAVGVFCSACTRSQVVAAVTAIAVLALCTIVPYLIERTTALSDFWRDVVKQAVFRRYADFSKGIIDPANIVFFGAATAVFMFLSVKVMEARRWR
jgi:ABC-2 type transport system permease protein